MIEIISGDKFKHLRGIFYQSMDELWAGNPRPTHPYILVTHGGDPPINQDYAHILKDPNLMHWYATNAALQHDKLTAIPVGVEYNLSTAQRKTIEDVLYSDIPKDKNVFCGAFTVHHWVEERQRCLDAMKHTGLMMDNRVSYREYLLELKRHRFCLCPIGNGIDTFRLWEALYMGCIPVITRRINKERVLVEQYKHDNVYSRIPKIKIDYWEDFNPGILTEYLYNATYFKSDILDFGFWRKKINDQLIFSHIK